MAMCSGKKNASLECLSKYFFLWILLRVADGLYEFQNWLFPLDLLLLSDALLDQRRKEKCEERWNNIHRGGVRSQAGQSFDQP